MFVTNNVRIYKNSIEYTYIPSTMVTWNINSIDIKQVVSHLLIINADIVHLQGAYRNKSQLIESLSRFYHNIITNDHKQYYMYNDCGLLVFSKCPITSSNFISYGYWKSYIYSGYIFYSIGDLNFCNCCLDSPDNDKTYSQLERIMATNPYKDKFIIGGYIDYPDTYTIFGKKPNNTLTIIDSKNYNTLLSFDTREITTNTIGNIDIPPVIGIIKYLNK
jgi:hypothetical protein